MHYDDKPKVTVKTKGGISFLGLLTIVFIVLKLCKIIEWSWVWVLSPLWIPFAVGLLVIAFICIKIPMKK